MFRFGIVPACLAAVIIACAGCSGIQSSLNAVGPQSMHISRMWWLLFGVSVCVYLLVLAFLLYALRRAKLRREPDTSAGSATLMKTGVIAATVITVIILFVLMVASFRISGSISNASIKNSNPVTVQVIGHQWWWEIHYPNPTASDSFVTANEMHIPVGRPVQLKLTSNDVIHSFWVPNLHGKMDLIPGKENTTWFEASKEGTYRGQCAEFCGLQHAHMAFWVIAESPAKFYEWANRQRQASVEPLNPGEQRGKEVFLSSACILCHTIRGTGASGQVAPDLTHLASRAYIAAATLPNRRGHLAGWIVDPQNIKPGNRMPPNNIPPGDLDALLDYLESLK